MRPPRKGPNTIGAVPVAEGSPPSSYAVVSALNHEPGAFVRLLGVTVLRGVLIVPGVWLVSRLMDPRPKLPWVIALSGGASVTITAGLVIVYWLSSKFPFTPATTTPPAPSGQTVDT